MNSIIKKQFIYKIVLQKQLPKISSFKQNMSFTSIKQLSNSLSQFEKNVTLEQLLSNNNMPLFQLLSLKNIQPKIRSNLTYFIRYCQQNQQFCFNLIDIGIRCPMHLETNQDMRNVCYIAADILTCDQDVVADLFILPCGIKLIECKFDKYSHGFQGIQEDIETQVQGAAKCAQIKGKHENITPEQKFQSKYKYLIRLFQYIVSNQTKDLDQNCINYMIKSLNCLVRKKASEFFIFLQKKFEILKRLIDLNQFSSINQLFVKILSDDELQGQKNCWIKKSIVEGVLQRIKDSLPLQDFVERLDFLDQLFQTNKYSSDDDRTQLQKISDIFVSKQTIDFFYSHLINPKDQNQFYNATSYLNTVVKRMNIDEQVNPYAYSNQPKEQTMKFQMDILFKQFNRILVEGHNNVENLNYSEKYKKKLAQTRFYQFLVSLTKNSRLKNYSQDVEKLQSPDILKGDNVLFEDQQHKILIINELLKQFAKQSKNGINRIYIISIIQKVLSMQIFSRENHIILELESVDLQIKKQQHVQHHDKKNEQNEQNGKEENPQFKLVWNDQMAEAKVPDDQSPTRDQKNIKIDKNRARIKLDIIKLSAQNKVKQEQAQNKKEEELSIKKMESSLKKQEVLKILEQFNQLFNEYIEQNGDQMKKYQKNNQSQLGAFINKIVINFCDSIHWQVCVSEDVLLQNKRDFTDKVQSIFPLFKFKKLCKNYSTTLATDKHPNAQAKQKTNPQLCFVQEFSKTYGYKNDKQADKSNQIPAKNLQLDDSDFNSQDDDEGFQDVKCSLQKFIEFTSFEAEPYKPMINFTIQPSEKDEKSKQEKCQQDQNHAPNLKLSQLGSNEVSSYQQKWSYQMAKKLQPIENQDTRTNEQKQKDENNEKQVEKDEKDEEQKKNKEKIQTQNVVQAASNMNQTVQKYKSINQTSKTQKIPSQFYIKHPVIFV